MSKFCNLTQTMWQ